MKWRTAIRAVMVSVALLAPTACSNGAADRDSAGANPTLATDPPTTTTTNPYAVPAVIDVAYVNRVLAGLDAAVGDITRLVVRTRTIPREAYDGLKALYADSDFLQIQIDNFQNDLRKGLAGYKSEPGNATTIVSRLITSRPTCVFAEVQREYSAVGTNTSDKPHTVWIALRPLDRSRDPGSRNPTTWAYIYDGFTPTRTQPSDPCAAY